MLPVHHMIVTASVMVAVIFLHKMVDGMDKVVVKQLQYSLHINKISRIKLHIDNDNSVWTKQRQAICFHIIICT